jgi:hypothetical protein
MTIERAIKKAIMEGAYGPSFWRTRHERDPHTNWTRREWDEVYSESAQKRMFLDPSFWQSLIGKAATCDKCGEIIEVEVSHCADESAGTYHVIGEWQYKWHRFIDHLAEGGTAETFFETLT